MELTRNFCIIAHIDHGKSTLADRILEVTGSISSRNMEEQVLDSMDIERERGITIKARAVRLNYQAADGNCYVLNLIDTPGHVDFTYEVSRSLAACEGALLVIDATQGIEAQTLANLYMALEHDLVIIPVINKIDLPSADPDEVKREIEDLIGIDGDEAILASAKEGVGIADVLEAIVKRIPPPKGSVDQPLKSLIFDSHFDPYRGVIAYVRVYDGRLTPGMKIRMMSTENEFELAEIGVFRPRMEFIGHLEAGDVGFISAGIKNVKQCHVGDTITEADRPAQNPLPGYRGVKPMVFCGMYPTETSNYDALREALEKLQLNDASLVFEPETSAALGQGFRCGFLGLLHMDVIQERLEREHGIDLITTAPSVVYRVSTTSGELIEVDNPSRMPEPTKISLIEEPYTKLTIITPSSYMGPIMDLVMDRRGTFVNMEYVALDRVILTYEAPLSEIIYDFFDQLKSRSHGYASLDYEITGYKSGDLVKLDILINGEPVDALSAIVDEQKAQAKGRRLVEKLRSLIPRQLFEIPIQAAIGSKIVARESVRALRKDVIAKCYGGDVSRKRKLLEKQKEGKKRMKQLGSISIPQEAFMAVLSREDG